MKRVSIATATIAVVVTLSTVIDGAVNKISFDSITDRDYDVIVVGAGTGGCIAAETFGAAKMHTLLIERGYDVKSMSTEHRFATSLVAAPAAMIDDELTETVFTDRGVPYVVGKTMGGTSATNLGVYAEEDETYFDMLTEEYAVTFDPLEWQKATDYIRKSGILSPALNIRDEFFRDFAVADEKVTKKHETHESPSGTDGDRPLSHKAKRNAVGRTFTVLNGVTNERATSCDVLKSGYIDLLERATVNSIVFEDLGPAHNAKANCISIFQATDGEADDDGNVDVETKACIRAGGKIVLSAGVINTPAILMRSGVGDSETLEGLGIKSIVHNPDVGRHFHDKAISATTTWPKADPPETDHIEASRKSFNGHYLIRDITNKQSNGTIPIVVGELTGGSTFAVFAGLLAEKRSKDPTTGALFQRVLRSQAVQLYERVKARLASDIKQFFDFVTKSVIPEKEGPMEVVLDKFENLVACSRYTAASTVHLADPRSRGVVSLNHDLQPTLKDVYFSDEGGLDMEDTIQAVRRVSEVLETNPLFGHISDKGDSCLKVIEPVMLKAMFSASQRSALYPPAPKDDEEEAENERQPQPQPITTKDVFPPMPSEATDENMKTLIDVFYLPAWHATSTASLNKVVNMDFNVRGVEQLAVLDASVLPQSTRVDPLATVMALGRYGARRVMEDMDRSERKEFE